MSANTTVSSGASNSPAGQLLDKLVGLVAGGGQEDDDRTDAAGGVSVRVLRGDLRTRLCSEPGRQPLRPPAMCALVHPVLMHAVAGRQPLGPAKSA